MKLIELAHCFKNYHTPQREIAALDDVSLQLDRGDFVAVRGPSGCGKSTLLLACGGMQRPDRGTVEVLGRPLYELDDQARSALRSQHIGFVFQQFHLVPYLTVWENVLVAYGGEQPRDKIVERTHELLARFDLTQRAEHVPGKLSTGERQRTALARALINSPELILADEPTGNLDGQNAEIVLQALAEFADAGGGVLLVTHDQRSAGYAHKHYEMTAGRLMEGVAATV
ncbi:MAG: ABC transporter ATP-binding protein [Pirellulales bacterium]